jgi:DNA-binding response OmpR family regulator
MQTRLLLVDDNRDLANMLVTFFEKEGFQTEWVWQGQKALDRAIHFRPHLIILDVMMPDVDGYAVCRQLRTHHRTSHVPILFLTALSSRDDVIAGLNLGIDDYVVKPFDLEEFRLRVKNKYLRSQIESPTDAVTGLPGRKLIDDYIHNLPAQSGFAAVECRLNAFEEFREVYGFLAADDVLRLTATLIDEVLEEHGRAGDFVGHPGGAEFVVVPGGQSEAVARRLAERFDKAVPVCYSFVDRGRGYLQMRAASGLSAEKRAPLMTMSVAITNL